jgi:hypothetical protein
MGVAKLAASQSAGDVAMQGGVSLIDDAQSTNKTT